MLFMNCFNVYKMSEPCFFLTLKIVSVDHLLYEKFENCYQHITIRAKCTELPMQVFTLSMYIFSNSANLARFSQKWKNPILQGKYCQI